MKNRKETKTESPNFIFTATCPARSGIVAAITTFLAERNCYICELSQFDDQENEKLFLRAVFRAEKGDDSIESWNQMFTQIAEKFQMTWNIVSEDVPMKTLVMVSQWDHCLEDILYRLRKGQLNIEITAVVSNHLVLRPIVEREGIRFVYLPITKENKLDQEKVLLDIVNETNTELVVLARYMQILSDGLCSELQGRAINIHHSFLPGFKGAKPYHQAFERGVKLIGATAHYVTADLDEGPIIEQAVQSVDHTYSPQKLVAAGQDTETQALSKAIKLHTEHRVFMDANKTVILR